MNFHIITLFPGAFDSYLNESIIKRAIEDGKIKVHMYNPRDFAYPKSKKQPTYSDRRVDDKPYGGGPGMVIEALPVIRAIDAAIVKIKKSRTKKGGDRKGKSSTEPKIKIVFFSPSGEQFTNSYAKEVSQKFTDLILICGRYEGIDARVKKVFPMEDITVGPYVLTGGELPAMIMLDAVSRQVEGVLGDIASLEESRIASPYVYTRPEVIEYVKGGKLKSSKTKTPTKKSKFRVPDVLLSGNHKLIEEWRKGKTN